jgi:hypothetical protein
MTHEKVQAGCEDVVQANERIEERDQRRPARRLAESPSGVLTLTDLLGPVLVIALCR